MLDTKRNYWWIQPALTLVIVGAGIVGSYTMSKERIRVIGIQIEKLQTKGSDPVHALETRVSVLEERMYRYMESNSKDHDEIKIKLDKLIAKQSGMAFDSTN
jgi:hypothetical protein